MSSSSDNYGYGTVYIVLFEDYDGTEKVASVWDDNDRAEREATRPHGDRCARRVVPWGVHLSKGGNIRD